MRALILGIQVVCLRAMQGRGYLAEPCRGGGTWQSHAGEGGYLAEPCRGGGVLGRAMQGRGYLAEPCRGGGTWQSHAGEGGVLGRAMQGRGGTWQSHAGEGSTWQSHAGEGVLGKLFSPCCCRATVEIVILVPKFFWVCFNVNLII